MPERGERLLVPQALSIEMQQPPPWAAKVPQTASRPIAPIRRLRFSHSPGQRRSPGPRRIVISAGRLR